MLEQMVNQEIGQWIHCAGTEVVSCLIKVTKELNPYQKDARPPWRTVCMPWTLFACLFPLMAEFHFTIPFMLLRS